MFEKCIFSVLLFLQGFAFINYASFEASDAAIEAMNSQYLCNRKTFMSTCIHEKCICAPDPTARNEDIIYNDLNIILQLLYHLK